MPGKRSKYNKARQFCCPYCDRRLWRLGSPKHFLFYTDASELQQNVKMSRKQAALLTNQDVYVDRNSWLEEFLCSDHGKLWLRVTQKEPDQLVTTIANRQDWQHTTRTRLAEARNPSVSEFTHRMSRQTGKKDHF